MPGVSTKIETRQSRRGCLSLPLTALKYNGASERHGVAIFKYSGGNSLQQTVLFLYKHPPGTQGLRLTLDGSEKTPKLSNHNFHIKQYIGEMDSQEIFGDFGSKGSRLRCFVLKLIWPSWGCGQFNGVYVEIGYAWIPWCLKR